MGNHYCALAIVQSLLCTHFDDWRKAKLSEFTYVGNDEVMRVDDLFYHAEVGGTSHMKNSLFGLFRESVALKKNKILTGHSFFLDFN